jgi:hypothetical protein
VTLLDRVSCLLIDMIGDHSGWCQTAGVAFSMVSTDRGGHIVGQLVWPIDWATDRLERAIVVALGRTRSVPINLLRLQSISIGSYQ